MLEKEIVNRINLHQTFVRLPSVSLVQCIVVFKGRLEFLMSLSFLCVWPTGGSSHQTNYNGGGLNQTGTCCIKVSLTVKSLPQASNILPHNAVMLLVKVV